MYNNVKQIIKDLIVNHYGCGSFDAWSMCVSVRKITLITMSQCSNKNIFIKG